MVKWVASAAGIGGAVVGGYYGVEALTNHSIPVVVRNTIEKELKKGGYEILRLKDDKWQEKFNEFRKNDNLTKLKTILQEAKGDKFTVTKDDENEEGGKALKDWCIEVLDLETKDAKGNKTLDNAKVFCAELKKPTEVDSAASSPGAERTG